MSKLKFRILLSLSVIAILGVSFFLAIRFFVKPEIVERRILPRLEQIIHGEVQYENAELRYFPSLSVQLNKIDVAFKSAPGANFKADKLQIHAYVLPAFLGKGQIKKIEVEGGVLDWSLPAAFAFKQIKMEDLEFNLSSIDRNAPMKLNATSTLEGVQNALSLKGVLKLDKNDPWNWTSSAFNGSLGLKDFPVRILEQRLREEHKVRLKDGLVTVDAKITKEKDSGWVDLKGNANLDKFIYEIQKDSARTSSPSISSELGFDFGWNRDLEKIDFRRVFLELPIGLFEMSGGFMLGTGEVEGIRISATDVVMESVPHYYVPLKDAIPFNFGFSGLSNLEMNVEGTVDHLSLHASWDLTPALLTYGRFFNKPKDFPFNATFDYLLQEGHLLAGDFSIRSEEALLKGTFSELDLRTGDGQLNIITNKFDLDRLQPLLLPFEGYDLGGYAKVLLNLKGSFAKPSEMERLLNLTISKGSLKYQDGEVIDQINLALDYSPLGIDIREVQFGFGSEPAKGKLRIYNLGKDVTFEGDLVASEFKLSLLTKTVYQMLLKWYGEEKLEVYRALDRGLRNLLPETETLKDFKVALKGEGNQWEISESSFKAYDGDVTLQATMDYDVELPTYWVDYRIDRLSMAKYTGRLNADNKLMDGTLFMQAQFVGAGLGAYEWQDRIQGEGNFMVTNGEFYTVNLPKVVGSVEPFAHEYLLNQTTTSFSDLRFDFTLRSGKIISDKLVLVSQDFFIEGEGDVSLEGFLNYRLGAYFSTELTQKIIAPIFGENLESQNYQFGPVPLLVSNRLESAELKLDSVLLPKLLDDLEGTRRYQVLRRDILPEETLFPRVEER